MSFNIEQVRKAFADPNIAKFSEMTKRIARLEADNVEIETDDLTGFGDLDNTNVIYTDYWNFIKRYAQKRDFVFTDGTDDYVDLGARTNLWSKNITQCSFSLWACPLALTLPYHTLFGVADDAGAGNTDAEFSLYYSNNGPTGYYIGLDVTNDNYTNTMGRWSTDKKDIIGLWSHILVTYNANNPQGNRVKLYVDGYLQSNVNDYDDGLLNGSIIDINSNTKAFLGIYLIGVAGNFNGRTRDFRWWNTELNATDAISVWRGEPQAPTPDYWLPLTAIDSGNPVDSIAGLTTTLVNGALFQDRIDPRVVFEPDFQKFALDLRFEALTGQLYNYSQHPVTAKYATIFGEPCPATASEVFYRGGYKRNTGWTINQKDHVYLTMPHDIYFGLDVAQSWIFRLNFKSVNAIDPITGVDTSQTLVEKYDDADSQYFIRVGSDANIKAGFNDNGVITKLRTSNNPIIIGRDHEIVVTFDGGTTVKIYLDGQLQPTTTTTEGFDGSTNTDLHLLASVIPSNSAGYCDLNYIDCIKFYDSLALSLTQVQNHYKNKFTISSVDQGDAGITDASVCGHYDPTISFNDPSFTTTSFTAG